MTKADRIRWLETFIRIVERGSISAAARDFGFSQASASRQLAALEAELGSRLIARSTHALSLTEDGERLLPEARALVAGWAALEDKADPDGPLSGPIRVIVPVALGQTVLMPTLVRFQEAHPLVSVTWRLEDSPIRFAEEGCDVWINIGRPPDETLISQEVSRVKRMVVAAPSFETIQSPENLVRRPYLSLSPFEGTRMKLLGPEGQTAIQFRQTRLATNSIMVSHKAALSGLGFAILPFWLIVDDLAAGRLVDILPGWTAPSLPITINFAPATRTSRRMVAFRKAMSKAIAESVSTTLS